MLQRTSKNRRSRLSQFDQLGDRIVPAVLVTTLDLDGDGGTDDIRIVGDAQNSTVTIHDNGNDQLTVTVDANSNGSLLDTGDLQKVFTFNKNSVVVHALLGNGHDTFNYFADADLSGDTRNFFVNLGNGNDKFNWDMANHQVMASTRLAIELLGGNGHDQENISFGAVDSSLISVNSNLGNHNDTYNLLFANVDDGASVDILTDLGHGLNTHNVSLAGIGKFDKAVMDMAITGGNHQDKIDIKLNDDVGAGQVSSRFNLDVNLNGGNDIFNASLDPSFRTDNQSQATLKVRGGAGNDSLYVKSVGNGTLQMDADSLFSIDMDGGVGNDDVAVGIFPVIQGVTLNLMGTLRIRLCGGVGNDKITCILANNATSNGAYDIILRGDAGNDQMQFGLSNGGAAPITLGAAAGVIVDGGLGQDQFDNGSPNYTVASNLEVTI